MMRVLWRQDRKTARWLLTVVGCAYSVSAIVVHVR